MISPENRSPLLGIMLPGGAGLSIKVDVRGRLLLLAGNYAAGNGTRDHKCVLRFSRGSGASKAARNHHPVGNTGVPRKGRRPECAWRNPDANGDQYFLYSPISLPWMRTRLGGRMRTS